MSSVLRRDNCPLLILKYLSQDIAAFIGELDESTSVGITAVDTLASRAAGMVPEPSPLQRSAAGASPPLMALDEAASRASDERGSADIHRDLAAAAAPPSDEEKAPWAAASTPADVLSPPRTARPLLDTPVSPAMTYAAEGPARGQQVPSSGSLTTLTHDCPWRGADRVASSRALRVLSTAAGLPADATMPHWQLLGTPAAALEEIDPPSPVVFPQTALPVSRRRTATLCALLRVLHVLTAGRPDRIAADLVNYKCV